jgi:hypothetical protein
MMSQATEKRKLPRFHITPCQFHDEKLNKNFSVQDISLGGLAIRLVDRTHLPDFAIGTEHQGLVKVEGLKTSAKFIVRFIRGTLIGTEWTELTEILHQHLDDLSRPDHLGEHLKAYDLPDLANTVWYHNPVGVDLLYYQSSAEGASSHGISRWTLFIHHSFVQWEIEDGVKTGQTVAEDEEGYAHGIVRLETRLIDYDAMPDRRLIETAIELIEHAAISQIELKKLTLNQLRGV